MLVFIFWNNALDNHHSGVAVKLIELCTFPSRNFKDWTVLSCKISWAIFLNQLYSFIKKPNFSWSLKSEGWAQVQSNLRPTSSEVECKWSYGKSNTMSKFKSSNTLIPVWWFSSNWSRNESLVLKRLSVSRKTTRPLGSRCSLVDCAEIEYWPNVTLWKTWIPAMRHNSFHISSGRSGAYDCTVTHKDFFPLQYDTLC